MIRIFIDNSRRPACSERTMKLLTVSTLYPNAAAPSHGVFVENRLDAWRRHSGGEARVIAPVPYFPFNAPIFGKYAKYAAAPFAERRRDIGIRHPRYFLLPKVGMSLAPASLARTIEKSAREALAEGYDFDLIDAHYLYPDGVAAVAAARALGKPVVLTARGSDVTQIAAYPRQQAMILNAIFRADAVIAVAEALKDDLIRLGAPTEKITVLRNGVDLARFRPLDRDEIRRRMKLKGPVIASVGHLIDRKGHDIVIKALAEMPGTTLLVIGEGGAERKLKALAALLGVAGRVRFLGALSHESLAEIYNAADALVLASTREGWPNVLLEAMACGTPAIASNAGGSAEAVATPAAGRIVADRTPSAFAAALRDVLQSSDRNATRAHAETFSWDETSAGLSAIYSAVMTRAKTRASIRFAPAISDSRGKPKLVVTVDTEEEFDWRRFSPTALKVSPPQNLDRFQALCEEFGARPLYFITYPLLADTESVRYFRALFEQGRADLGLHLHQWVTPPIGGYEGEYYSWQCNLPPAVHEAKLKALAHAFEQAFGFRAVAHRAGRYGVSAEAYNEIAGAGIRYDFSPSPAFDFSPRGGPDFSGVSNHPFTVGTERGEVFVTPVSGARALRGGRVFFNDGAEPGLPARARRRFGILAAPLRLTCEQARFQELVSLTKSLVKQGTPLVAFSMHSTTMTPGGNPYAPDKSAVDARLALIRRYYDFFTKKLGGEFIGLSGLADLRPSQN